MIGMWRIAVLSKFYEDDPPNLWWFCNRYNHDHLDFTEVCEHVCLGVRIAR